MIGQVSLLVMLVKLVDRVPAAPPAKRGRGRPKLSTERLFLNALLIMVVRHLLTVHELLTVLEHPTPEMQLVRTLLSEQGKDACRRTWHRRLAPCPPPCQPRVAASAATWSHGANPGPTGAAPW